MLRSSPGLIVAVMCALIMFQSCPSVASGAKVMVVNGTVGPDSTLSNTVGWRVTVYSYQEPPPEMSYLPPTGHKITEATCDLESRYEFQLNVDDLLAQGITKIVVFAHPNPSGGRGWQVLEVKEGTYTVDLMASNLPALPSATASTTSVVSQSTSGSPQTGIPGFPVEAILLGLVAGLLIVGSQRRLSTWRKGTHGS